MVTKLRPFHPPLIIARVRLEFRSLPADYLLLLGGPTMFKYSNLVGVLDRHEGDSTEDILLKVFPRSNHGFVRTIESLNVVP